MYIAKLRIQFPFLILISIFFERSATSFCLEILDHLKWIWKVVYERVGWMDNQALFSLTRFTVDWICSMRKKSSGSRNRDISVNNLYMRGSHYYTQAMKSRRTRVTRDLSGRWWWRWWWEARVSPDEKERKYAVSNRCECISSRIRSFPEFWVKFSRGRKVSRSRRVDNVLPQSSPKAKVDASRSGDWRECTRITP